MSIHRTAATCQRAALSGGTGGDGAPLTSPPNLKPPNLKRHATYSSRREHVERDRLCHLGIHRYLRHRSPDGDGHFEECSRCHKQRDAFPPSTALPLV